MGIEKLSADANYLNIGQDFLDWHWWNCVKLQWKKPDQIIGVLLGLDQICYTQFFICRKKPILERAECSAIFLENLAWNFREGHHVNCRTG